MGWYFNGEAKISNLNPRAEGTGEEKKPALDIDLEAEVEVDELRNPLGAATSKEVKQAFWTETTANEGESAVVAPRFPSMGQVNLPSRELEGYRVEMAGALLSDCKLHKFKFEVQDGYTAKLKWQVSTSALNKETVPKIHECLGRVIPAKINQQQQEMDLGEGEVGGEGGAWE